ncbi:MAG: epoxyqueuosine reductase QueH [Sulfurospirillum sp.]|nr:epoxyqueuosine reductase QueH [Sulfurospirillum sp.]
MLVHICCSVDSHFFLQKLQKLYPDKKLTGFFYDPNIHPFSEYQLRLLDVQRSCKKLGIKLLEGVYDFDGWMEAVRGLEHEPEKGKRCSVCFDNRLEATAQKALELGESEITTTLLTSPKKSIEQLLENAKYIEQRYGLRVSTPDFRKAGGTSEQFALAKRDQLYHQNYCGCIFALEVQREQQDRLKDELMSPITRQILPASIEERLKLYKQVQSYECKLQKFILQREKFLNYRLLRAYLRDDAKEVIPSYVLFYSHMQRDFIRSKIAYSQDGIAYSAKEEIIFLHVEKCNELLKTKYASVKEMLRKPPSIRREVALRKKLTNTNMLTLHPIVVLDSLSMKHFEMFLEDKIYPDVREILVKVR